MVLTRRKFLQSSALGISTLALSEFPFLRFCREAQALGWATDLSQVEARFYKKVEQKEVICQICPRECRVADKERGYCGARENKGGVYYTLVYGRPCTVHVDPIEKKPFFHFLPGTTAFSFATAGCNVNCKFCQNWEISQFRPEQTRNFDLPPQELVELAKEKGSLSIASTYSEPVIFYEYVYDTAKLGQKRGLRNVMISGGYINREPLVELCRYLDGVKIDLKAFTEKYYREIVQGKLAPILETLKILKEIGIWYEIVYLMVPTLNDGEKEIKEMCQWIMANLGPDVPLHFTRFYPMYLLKNLPPTPVSTLERSRRIALNAGLHFVYIGNVPGHEGEHTYCPKCKKAIIQRVGFRILVNDVQKGRCRFCKEKIPGVWA